MSSAIPDHEVRRRRGSVLRQGFDRISVADADVDALAQGSFVLPFVGDTDHPALRLDAHARQVRFALAGVTHDRPDVRDAIEIAVPKGVRPEGGLRRTAVVGVMVSAQPVADFVGEDRTIVGTGVRGPTVGVLREVLRRLVAKQQVVLSARASKRPGRLSSEEMNQIGAVLPSQAQRLPVVPQLRDDRGSVQTVAPSADPVQPRELGHMDDSRAHSHIAVPQDHVQVVAGASNRRSGSSLVRPIRSRSPRVHDQDVELFVALGRLHSRGQIDRQRSCGRAQLTQEARIGNRTHGTEGFRLRPRQRGSCAPSDLHRRAGR